MALSEDNTGKSSGILILNQPKQVTATCWSCGAMRAAHYCQECGKVQPPAPVDYFAFFGLPYKLNVDTVQLERDFYALSRKLHPDINARGTDPEQDWSLEKTSQLNDAYRTLKDPISRTEYLLRLQGVQLEEQSKAATDEARKTGAAKKQVVPPDLLEEVFELNMQLEEMRMAQKAGEADPDLQSSLEQAKRKFDGLQQEVDQDLRKEWQLWDEGDIAARKKAEKTMVALLDRRRYLSNLVRDVTETLGAE